jgi:hypothetical protein
MSKKNAAELFGKSARKPGPANVSVNWKLPDQYVGLELEIEVTKTTVWPEHYWPNWTQTRDGSLRNGREYILSMPLKGDALSKAIANLFHGSSWERSTTGSTHIHLDMMEETTTIAVIKVLALLIYSMEAAIFRYLGVGREWCGFTNKLSSAPDSLIAAVLNSTEDDNYRDLYLMCHDNGDVGRYYGMNLMALSKHNTVEFRYFPTAVNQDELIEWVQMVMSFKAAATELGTVEALVSTFSNEDSYYRFISSHFAEWKDKFLTTVPYYRAMSMVKKAMAIAESRRVQDTPYRFVPEAITSNPVFSRFVLHQVAPTPQFNFIYPVYNDPAPLSSSVPVNTVMLYQGDFYIATARSWHTFSDITYDGTDEQRAIMHAALSSTTITRAELMALGYSGTNAGYAITRQGAAVRQLANSLGIDPINNTGTDTRFVAPPAWHPDDEDMEETYDPDDNEDTSWANLVPDAPSLEIRPSGQPIRGARRHINDILSAYNFSMDSTIATMDELQSTVDTLIYRADANNSTTPTEGSEW